MIVFANYKKFMIQRKLKIMIFNQSMIIKLFLVKLLLISLFPITLQKIQKVWIY